MLRMRWNYAEAADAPRPAVSISGMSSTDAESRVRERAARARRLWRRRLPQRRDVNALVVGRRRRLRRLGNITIVGLGVVPGVVAV